MKKSAIAIAVAASFLSSISGSTWAQTPGAAEPVETPQNTESVIVTGQFIGTGGQSAMKLDVPVRDTPFSISSYTESFIKALEATKIDDMYNYMTGVKKAGNTGYDISLRGFKTTNADRNAIMVDGLPGLTGRFASPPTVSLDHVELVKGPMSVLYGQAQPGGFINLVSKKPKSAPAVAVDVRATTYDGAGLAFGHSSGAEADIDATGPIDAGGKFLYRVIGDFANRDLWRNGTYEKPFLFSPSLTWNISDSTFATVQVEYRHLDASYDLDLVAPNRDASFVASPRTRYQEPGDYQNEAGKTLSLALEHTFENKMRWSFASRDVRNADDTRGWDNVAVRPNFLSLQRRARRQHNERSFDFADTNLTIPFDTGPISHRLIAGINGGTEIDDFDRIQFFNGGACPGPTCLDIDIYNPVYGRVPPLESLPAGTVNRRYTRSTSLGVYFSDLITVTENWKFNLGARETKDYTSIKELKLLNVPDQSKDTKKALPLVGLLFQPDKEWTYYASYSTSYVPAAATAQDVNGLNPFKPELGKQIEGGVKAEGLLDGRVNATLALFKIDKQDALTTFSCPIGTCTSQLGAEQSKGVEVELNLRPVPNWQVTFGYAYTDAKVKDSTDPAQVGATLTAEPRNSANLWSSYEIDAGVLKGLVIGAGANYTSVRPGLLPTTADRRTMPIQGYTIVDLGLSYLYDRYAFNLKVGNLFDRRYLDAPGFTGDLQVTPGNPRNFTFSVAAHF